MKDKDYNELLEFQHVGGGLIPVNPKAIELLEHSRKGEIIQFKEITARDLKFHKCYMSLLGFIYDYLPTGFRNRISKDRFYIFLKKLQGLYTVEHTFKDGTEMIKYHSISFGNMSQKKFEEYVKNQLPFIYEEVIRVFFDGDIANGIIDTIEEEYKKFMSKL
jgi:hypothetical protein